MTWISDHHRWVNNMERLRVLFADYPWHLEKRMAAGEEVKKVVTPVENKFSKKLSSLPTV